MLLDDAALKLIKFKDCLCSITGELVVVDVVVHSLVQDLEQVVGGQRLHVGLKREENGFLIF